MLLSRLFMSPTYPCLTPRPLCFSPSVVDVGRSVVRPFNITFNNTVFLLPLGLLRSERKTIYVWIVWAHSHFN